VCPRVPNAWGSHVASDELASSDECSADCVLAERWAHILSIPKQVRKHDDVRRVACAVANRAHDGKSYAASAEEDGTHCRSHASM
jgi:hypothetical protein